MRLLVSFQKLGVRMPEGSSNFAQNIVHPVHPFIRILYRFYDVLTGLIAQRVFPRQQLPSSLCDIFTPAICETFFHAVCVVTPAPRLQLHAAALLARMAGHQPWWGKFLANTLVNLYSTSSSCIFPQDRYGHEHIIVLLY